MVVRFAKGLRCVTRQSLALLDGSGWPGISQAPTQRRERLSQWQRRASRWLEALRLGTVSHGDGDLFTVGRASELACIESDLKATLEQGGACRVFCGPYGVGKSHLLEVLAQRSRDQRLAISRVVLDRKKVSACRPRRLYSEIVAGLSLPGASYLQGAPALAAIFDAAVSQENGLLSGQKWEAHPYFTPLLNVWRILDPASESRRELLYWISGGERQANRRLRARLRRETGSDPGPLYSIKDHRTVWNQLTSLVSGLACLIRETGLAQGLVLILDEAEMCAVESAADQRHGDRTLTGLAAAALGGRHVRRPELLRELGGHSATREFPAFHRSRNHLYLALGMASRSRNRGEVLERLLPKEVFVDLTPLDRQAVGELLETILASYRQAFPHFEISAGFARPLVRLLDFQGGGSSSPRQIVQQALAFLDGARLWPGSVESYIEECLAPYG